MTPETKQPPASLMNSSSLQLVWKRFGAINFSSENTDLPNALLFLGEAWIPSIGLETFLKSRITMSGRQRGGRLEKAQLSSH